jgi:hypothetical protein
MTTLKGYFGEIMTYAIAESFDACGHSDWEVPGFPFRFHVTAFQRLEAQRLDGRPMGTIIGRTGDDCLAFRRDAKGAIVGVLYCEAKCTATHDPSLIEDAHKKLTGPGPVDVLNLIEILSGDPTPENTAWIDALRRFRDAFPSGKIIRYDLACYLCGQWPKRSPTWIDVSKPHAAYGSTGRTLESVEVHLTDVEDKIRAVYSPEGWV